MIPIQKKLLFSFIAIIFLSNCGSDVDPGTIEGPPRSSEAIFKQDLNFLRQKKKLLVDDSGDKSQILLEICMSIQRILLMPLHLSCQ